MSRRRSGPQHQREKIETEVPIVCTGLRHHKPTHEPKRIDTATLWPDGSIEVDRTIPGVSTPSGRMAGVTYRFRCEKCKPTRDVPLRESTLRKILEACASAGRGDLDISAI